ncbi:unnamed protein product [Darwinula stevensoni]|uniref:Uncharacterized protein n=1 Tax=Darwinula stevensoni TaxID=69355 RepID=A0A7R8X923_9CRUS|nr:unnamed protein product [Darwinula stevensoni]CAG0883954.1 unnamed protein product [Darwinula stevensoni]
MLFICAHFADIMEGDLSLENKENIPSPVSVQGQSATKGFQAISEKNTKSLLLNHASQPHSCEQGQEEEQERKEFSVENFVKKQDHETDIIAGSIHPSSISCIPQKQGKNDSNHSAQVVEKSVNINKQDEVKEQDLSKKIAPGKSINAKRRAIEVPSRLGISYGLSTRKSQNHKPVFKKPSLPPSANTKARKESMPPSSNKSRFSFARPTIASMAKSTSQESLSESVHDPVAPLPKKQEFLIHSASVKATGQISKSKPFGHGPAAPKTSAHRGIRAGPCNQVEVSTAGPKQAKDNTGRTTMKKEAETSEKVAQKRKSQFAQSTVSSRVIPSKQMPQRHYRLHCGILNSLHKEKMPTTKTEGSMKPPSMIRKRISEKFLKSQRDSFGRSKNPVESAVQSASGKAVKFMVAYKSKQDMKSQVKAPCSRSLNENLHQWLRKNAMTPARIRHLRCFGIESVGATKSFEQKQDENLARPLKKSEESTTVGQDDNAKETSTSSFTEADTSQLNTTFTKEDEQTKEDHSEKACEEKQLVEDANPSLEQPKGNNSNLILRDLYFLMEMGYPIKEVKQWMESVRDHYDVTNDPVYHILHSGIARQQQDAITAWSALERALECNALNSKDFCLWSAEVGAFVKAFTPALSRKKKGDSQSSKGTPRKSTLSSPESEVFLTPQTSYKSKELKTGSVRKSVLVRSNAKTRKLLQQQLGGLHVPESAMILTDVRRSARIVPEGKLNGDKGATSHTTKMSVHPFYVKNKHFASSSSSADSPAPTEQGSN